MKNKKDTWEDWNGLTPIELTGNYVPYELFDKVFPRIDNMSELKVVLFIVRRTVTFNKTEDWIAKTQFENGIYSKKTGERVNRGCGLSRPSIDEGIKRAINHSIIQERIECSRCGHEIQRSPTDRLYRKKEPDGTYTEKIIVHYRVPNKCPNCSIHTQGKMQYFYRLLFRDNH